MSPPAWNSDSESEALGGGASGDTEEDDSIAESNDSIENSQSMSEGEASDAGIGFLETEATSGSDDSDAESESESQGSLPAPRGNGLTDEQEAIRKKIMATRGTEFIMGSAGTGKSVLQRALVDDFETPTDGRSESVAVVNCLISFEQVKTALDAGLGGRGVWCIATLCAALNNGYAEPNLAAVFGLGRSKADAVRRSRGGPKVVFLFDEFGTRVPPMSLPPFGCLPPPANRPDFRTHDGAVFYGACPVLRPRVVRYRQVSLRVSRIAQADAAASCCGTPAAVGDHPI